MGVSADHTYEPFGVNPSKTLESKLWTARWGGGSGAAPGARQRSPDSWMDTVHCWSLISDQEVCNWTVPIFDLQHL